MNVGILAARQHFVRYYYGSIAEYNGVGVGSDGPGTNLLRLDSFKEWLQLTLYQQGLGSNKSAQKKYF